MNRYFAPGCALLVYKPHLAAKIQQFLDTDFGNITEYTACCHNMPDIPLPAEIINACSGCQRRYSKHYENVSAITLWEVLAQSDHFPFPDYGGMEMAIHDSCPTRKKEEICDAVRKLLKRMNITVIEPELTRENAVCCGDSYYGEWPKEEVLRRQTERAGQMPCEDVVVYCVSCIKSMANGSKKPHHLVDLLFNEETIPGDTDPDRWHALLEEFVAEH